VAKSSSRRIVCAACQRWLLNASGLTFNIETKCPKCGAVVTAQVRDGVLVSTQTGRAAEKVA